MDKTGEVKHGTRLSLDTVVRITEYHIAGMTVRSIAKATGVPRSTVQRVLKDNADPRNLKVAGKRRGRRRELSMENEKLLVSFVVSNRQLTNDQILRLATQIRESQNAPEQRAPLGKGFLKNFLKRAASMEAPHALNCRDPLATKQIESPSANVTHYLSDIEKSSKIQCASPTSF